MLISANYLLLNRDKRRRITDSRNLNNNKIWRCNYLNTSSEDNGIDHLKNIENPDRNSTRRIIVFVMITAALSSIFYFLIISSGTVYAHDGLYVLGWMWCPGIAALITSCLYYGDFSRFGWRWGKSHYQLLSYALPVLYSSAAYLIVWFSGLGSFRGSLNIEFLRDLIFLATIGTFASLVSALGEEIGWRGFLVPELMRITNFTKTSIISGVIWSLWHYPLILFADYHKGTPAWYGLSSFTIMIMGLSFALAWLRLKSGSLWTAAFLHTSHNLYIQQFFDPLTEDTGATKYFIGEFGLMLALVAVLVSYVFWKKRSELDKI